MRAMFAPRYGGPEVLELRELPAPTPADDEVLVRQRASSINAADWHLLRADPFFVRLIMGLTRPRHPVLGADVAGVVEAVGAKVTRFAPGDEVMGEASASGWGAFAELVAVAEKDLVAKPASVSFEKAAATPLAAMTALQGLRDHGGVGAGQTVLVNGASGGVGHFAVQIARHLGAEVTAVASAAKLDVLKAYQPDHVVDYTQTDVTQAGTQYDVIFELALFRALNDYKPILRPEGRFVYAGGESSRFLPNLLLNPLAPLLGRLPVRSFTAKAVPADLDTVRGWLESGVIRPHVDQTLPLEQLPDGIRHMESRKVVGKIVITI